MTDLQRLRAKLCRELAQSEYDARHHTRREASRLGDVAPAHALHAVAIHADAVRPRFEALLRRKGQRVGLQLGRAVGKVFAALRHALFDRVIDAERSYRGTLLGLRHGVDTARLLREVAAREGDGYLARFCDELITERAARIQRAEAALAWFAEEPALALRSGLRVALQPGALGDRAR